MRVVYELPVELPPNSQVRLHFVPEAVMLSSGASKCEVVWLADGPHLKAVNLMFLEQSVTTAEPIAPLPGFEETAFRFAAYVANFILKQTGLDAINAEGVLHRSPKLEPETKEEKILLSTRTNTVFADCRFDAAVRGPLDIFEIGNHVTHPSALALYADGLRATDIFVRFELFYRVMEYFFLNPQNNAPRHLRNCPDFSGKRECEIRGQVQSWDELRRRSVHPRPRRDQALHRDDLRALHEMRTHEPGMERVARWLLDNPPP